MEKKLQEVVDQVIKLHRGGMIMRIAIDTTAWQNGISSMVIARLLNKRLQLKRRTLSRKKSPQRQGQKMKSRMDEEEQKAWEEYSETREEERKRILGEISEEDH